MKAKIRTPFFEIGVKNYLYGDRVLELAKAADAAAKKYDIDVLFITPYADIRRIAENTERLLVFAPYMELLRPGRGMADVLPESLKAAGAKGVVLNHCERPMTITDLRKSINRARELELLSFVCADTLEEVKAVAQFHPDIINPESEQLIGTKNNTDMNYVRDSISAVKKINPGIIVEQAAGISTGEQVYRYIYAGAEGVGVASGICSSENPGLVAQEMIYSVRKAYDDRVEKAGELYGSI